MWLQSFSSGTGIGLCMQLPFDLATGSSAEPFWMRIDPSYTIAVVVSFNVIVPQSTWVLSLLRPVSRYVSDEIPPYNTTILPAASFTS